MDPRLVIARNYLIAVAAAETGNAKQQQKLRALAEELRAYIEENCDHQYVDDEIEKDVYGNTVRIRYCDVCGRAACPRSN